MPRERIPTAREVMNTRVYTIHAETEISEAVRGLLAHRDSGAPVVDAGGALLGVLSEHDCIRALAQAIADRWPQGCAADHMTREIETVAPTDDVLSLATRFSGGRHRRLLVVEDGRLVGLISRRDLLRALESLEKRLEGKRAPSTYEMLEQRHRELG